jgi:hypothetical protein
VRYKGFMSVTGMVRKIQIDNPISFNSTEASYGISLACFFIGDRIPSNTSVPALHSTLSGRMMCQTIPLPRLMLHYCACAPHSLRESQKYPSLSACTSKQNSLHGYPFKSCMKGVFRCQETTQLISVSKRRQISHLDGSTWRHLGFFPLNSLTSRMKSFSNVTTICKQRM